MNFRVYTDWKQLPVCADQLFEESSRQSLFVSREWLMAVSAELCSPDSTLLLACVISEDKMLGLLPLLQNAGKTLSYLHHRYSSHSHLLICAQHRERVLECLAKGVSELPVCGLLLEPIVSEDNNFADLTKRLEATGFSCTRHFRHYNWVHRVKGESYAAYLESRPTRIRHTLERKGRKLAREHGFDIRLYTDKDTLRGMSDYYAVYNASWKAREQYTDFVDRIVDDFRHKQWLRLAVMYIKDQPVAAHLWFVCHTRASIFRLAYDESWRGYSPGTLLMAFMMEHVIEHDKVQEIDFLTGNESYKQDWMSERRECLALSCVRNLAEENAALGLANRLRRLFC